MAVRNGVRERRSSAGLVTLEDILDDLGPPPEKQRPAIVPVPRSPIAAPPWLERLRHQPGELWLAFLATALTLVGALAPWATALNVDSISGTNGDPWIVFFLCAATMVALWRYCDRAQTSLLLVAWLSGVFAVLIGLYDLSRIQSRIGAGEPDWGIYLVIAGGAAMMVLSWACSRVDSPAD